MNESDRVSAADVQGLRAETGRLADSIEHVARRQGVTEHEIEVNRATIDTLALLTHRAKRNLRLALLGILLAALGTALGWHGISQRADENSQAIAIAAASRTEAQVAACHGYNDDVTDRVNGILRGLAASAADPVAAKALTDSFLLPRRNCTPEGIAAYYQSPKGAAAYEKPGG